ncbi:MAG: GyrI-like domain-containing protein [Sedimentisphaerales bacterium]|jgi:effector-binding domain-containing protein|nr:GyrI-like domain-containing protein [Sedimentisphaerales bacterium]NLT77193.1 GyrI-like domain-containing protein [Planctomycetota bacterium]
MNTEVSICQVEPQLVVGMRKRGTYAEIGSMIATVWRFAAGSGAHIAGRPTFICHETPKEAVKANEQSNADVEVVVPVAKKVTGTDRVTCYELPGGQMARIIHKGPYETCAATYKKLFAWIAGNHKKVTGPTREVYLNDPRKVAPDELLTEIYAPVT